MDCMRLTNHYISGHLNNGPNPGWTDWHRQSGVRRGFHRLPCFCASSSLWSPQVRPRHPSCTAHNCESLRRTPIQSLPLTHLTGLAMALSAPTPFWTTQVAVQYRNHFPGTFGTAPILCNPFSNGTHCHHPRRHCRRRPSDHQRAQGAGVEVGAGLPWEGGNCNSRVSWGSSPRWTRWSPRWCSRRNWCGCRRHSTWSLT